MDNISFLGLNKSETSKFETVKKYSAENQNHIFIKTVLFLFRLLFSARMLLVLETTLYSVTVLYLFPFHTKTAAKPSFSKTSQE